uniref:Zinc finger, CCHC-type n=1 Tax=Tanacetum cinerariifolium TaxID=118510 RepID=A0A6L2LJS6_TANCI|nr:zinc finger, CCHC-type [Tanacetum cinerariifolium]
MMEEIIQLWIKSGRGPNETMTIMSAEKDFKHTLKHLKEQLTLVELGSHLRIEESLRVQDNDKPKGNDVAGPSVVNMVEHNNSFRCNDNKGIRDDVSDQHFYCFNVEDDPKTFDEAMKSQDVAFWKEAINDEMDSIMGNNTWVLTDLPSAFLNGKLEEKVYMNQPLGFIMHGNENKACKLIKSLYELKQTPKQWHQKFDEVVLSNGHLLNQADKCVYNKFDESGKGVIICLYVDDMLIFGADPVQSHYIEKVIKKFNYSDCTLVSTPMDTYEKLMPNKGPAVSQLVYSRVIGCLMYAMTCTRPDIAFVMGKLSRYTSNPGTHHWQAIKSVLKYLKKTMNYRLVYSGYPSVLEGYTDASWISNTEDNSSTSGWVFLLGGGAISWAFKKQTCITGSIMESEFVALAATIKKAEWLKNLLIEIPLWVKRITSISIRCDSAATLAKAYSQKYNGKFRHLGVRHIMIRELIMNGVVSIEFVRSQQNLADHLTKGLSRDLIIKSAERMGLKTLNGNLSGYNSMTCKDLSRLLDPKLKTLGERGFECIFVGYAEHSKASRLYVIEPNDSVAINSIIKLRDVIFDEHRFSSVPRQSQRSLVNGTEDSSSLVVSERITDEDDPKTFDEAMKSHDVAFWKEAINDEMDSIMGNNTWVLTDLPPAFLNGKLEEKVYMNQPLGFIMHGNENKACKLIKSLYELKQTPKEWHQKFDVVLSNGYLLNQADKCVYNKFDESGKGVIICLYVDDMLIFGADPVQVIKKFNYSDCTLVSIPMDTYEKLMPNKGPAVSQLVYSRVIGCLMYAMTCTRPDIAFVMGKVSRLVYSGYPSVLEGYTDASWISNTEDNSSTSGWVFLLGGGVISWASKKQTCITGSTMESEFVALAATSKKAEWLKNLLMEIPLWVKRITSISIRCDSAATLARAYSQKYNGKFRHLGVRHNMIRELITNGVVSIEFVRSQQNLADHLTKGLSRDLIIKSAERMGLKSS